MKLIHLLIIASFILVFSECRKDYTDDEIIVIVPPSDDINTSIRGIIVDESGIAIEGASVEINNHNEISDENGVFNYQSISCKVDGQLLKISKSGYFDNFKQIIPNKDKETFIKLSLIQKESVSGSFMSSEGGQIVDTKGVKLVFDSNSIVFDENQNNYTGQVKVYTHLFDPSKNETYLSMPGNLGGVDQSGSTVQLETYGMVYVQLEGSQGEKLNIKSGNKVEMTIPLDETLTSSAPEEIPMWYLDEATGIWLEEGIALKTSHGYVAEVSHFSFWNCDVPYPLINIEGKLVDNNNIGIPYTLIQIKIKNQSNTAGSFTNDEGSFSGKVPKDEILEFSIFNECQELIHYFEAGPLGVDTDLGDIIIASTSLVTIQGSLIDCDGAAVSNGYITLSFSLENVQILPLNDLGEFNYSLLLCQPDMVTISGIDLNALNVSEAMVYNFSGLTTLDVGTLTACTEIDEYITTDVDGQLLTILDISAIIQGPNLLIYAGNGQDYIQFNIKGNTVGTHLAEHVSWTPEFSMSSGCGLQTYPDCDNLVSVEITEIGNIGEVIKGSLSGEIYDSSGELIDSEFEFKVILDDIQEKVSGIIWLDANENGIRENTEDLLYNEGMILTSGSNNQYYKTKLDGTYEFFVSTQSPFDIKLPGLLYLYSPQDVGSDDTVDSDFNEADGLLSNITIVHGSPLSFDGGLILSNYSCDISTPNVLCANENGLIIIEVVGLPAGSSIDLLFEEETSGISLDVTTTDNPYTMTDLPTGVEIHVTTTIDENITCFQIVIIPSLTDPIEINLTSNISSCEEGSFELVATGGTGPYSYEWGGGLTGPVQNDIAPGTYTVSAIDINGCIGTNDVIVSYGQNSIGNYVWLDQPGGVPNEQDGADLGIGGIVLLLKNEFDVTIQSTETNEIGNYQFTNMIDGDYYIVIEVPTSYELVDKDAGSTDENDSDADPATSITDLFTVEGCQVITNIDFGIKEN